jgi:integrase
MPVVGVKSPCAKSSKPIMPEKFNDKFTQTFLANPPDGVFTDGSGLYFTVRKNGKARSWSIRERGHRITIGPYAKFDLKAAQAKLREVRDRQAKGEDPFEANNHTAAADTDVETFASATRAFASKKLEDGKWRKSTYDQRQSELNKYIYGTAYANKPLKDMVARDILTIFKPTWKTTPETAFRCASMLQQMFEEAIKDDPPRHPGPRNPADMDPHSWLRRQLGGQGPSGNRHGMLPQDVPTLVAYLETPPFAHGDDEATTAEVAEAIPCREDAIHLARRQGKLPTWRKIEGYDFQNSTYVYKIAEVQKIWRFSRPLQQHAQIPIIARIVLFIIRTAVRSDMARSLKWPQVRRDDPRGPLIDFARDRDNTPLIGGHKTQGQDEADYTIPLTPDVDAMLREIEKEQKRDGLYRKDGYVFVHPPTRVGQNHRTGQKLGNTKSILDFYQRTMLRLGLVEPGQIIPSIHGLRNTFPEWALELNSEFSPDFVEAQLGHKHKLGGRNWMYYRNIKMLNQRRTMMEAWENYIRENAPKTPVKPVAKIVERQGVLLNQTARVPPKPWELLGMNRSAWYRYGMPKTRPPTYRKSIKELAAMVSEVKE